MDPDAALAIIHTQMAAFYALDPDVPAFEVTKFVDAVSALSEWIESGGRLPRDWQV